MVKKQQQPEQVSEVALAHMVGLNGTGREMQQHLLRVDGWGLELLSGVPTDEGGKRSTTCCKFSGCPIEPHMRDGQ